MSLSRPGIRQSQLLQEHGLVLLRQLAYLATIFAQMGRVQRPRRQQSPSPPDNDAFPHPAMPASSRVCG